MLVGTKIWSDNGMHALIIYDDLSKQAVVVVSIRLGLQVGPKAIRDHL
jgi:F0F1-type ATP synthase alpha subunit